MRIVGTLRQPHHDPDEGDDVTRRVLMLAAVLLLTACANDAANRAERDAGLSSAGELAAVDGAGAYNEYCASCHETGMLGAPIVGDADEWANRSQLWDAVLFDHALTGYLEMPAKGGRMDLPDDIVKAAAEYMLEITFPDRLHDCNPPLCTENGT
jgi:cytochrome c5